ncbi:MAG: hypothetical protein ABEJ30_01580 [Halorientalis sp.]
MERRHWAALGIGLLLVVGAGAAFLAAPALGGQGGDAHLTVSAAERGASGNETVAFSTLTTDQQRVFEEALDAPDGTVEVPADVDERVWIEHRYVAYRNRSYRVAVAMPG